MTPSSTWPVGRPRVLVTDAWLANAGDAAIALATDRLVRAVAPRAAVLHATYQREILAAAYPELTMVPPLAALTGVSRGLPEAQGWDEERGASLVRGADVVLSQGGGFLYEHYCPWARIRAHQLVIQWGLPLAYCGQSLGQFRAARPRVALGGLFRHAVAVGVRDATSADVVAEVSMTRSRVVLAGDLSLLLFDTPPEPDRARSGIALTVSAAPVATVRGVVAPPAALGARIAALVARLCGLVPGEPVTLWSTAQGLGGSGGSIEDDGPFARAIVSSLDSRSAASARTIEGHVGAAQAIDIVGAHRVVVSMRLHPVLFAIGTGTPALYVGNAAKAPAALEHLGMADSLGPPVTDVDAVVDRVAALLAAPVCSDERWSAAAPARARAGANRVVVERLVRSSR